MNKIFHLGTCSTCKRIITDLNLKQLGFEFQDIKTQHITVDQLDHMRQLSGSYESLFSRKSLQYKALGLGDKILQESDYRQYILDEYTFLKRPVILIGNTILVGNAAKTIDEARQKLTLLLTFNH